jgi:hypothetical protein
MDREDTREDTDCHPSNLFDDQVLICRQIDVVHRLGAPHEHRRRQRRIGEVLRRRDGRGPWLSYETGPNKRAVYNTAVIFTGDTTD